MTSVTPVATDRGPRERGYRLAILALVALLLVAMIAIIVLVTSRASKVDELEDAEGKIATYEAGPSARDAAEEILLEITSYDYRELDKEYAWLDSFATDELRTRYADQVPRLKKVIRLSKATAEGEVVQSAYETRSSSEVTVLAFVRQAIRDSVNKRAVIEEQWATLEMVLDDGEWLIGNIDLVTVPPPT